MSDSVLAAADRSLEHSSKKRSIMLVRIAAAVILVAVIVGLSGAREVGHALALVAPWLPLLLLCEGLRIPLETQATHALYGIRAAPIPYTQFVRVHLVGYAMMTVLPAGRALAEAYKAKALAGATSGPRAAAVATANQSLALIANGMVSVPCAVATYVATGWSVLTVAIIVHALVVVSGGVALRWVSRSERLVTRVSRFSARLATPLRRYREACEEHGVVSSRALAFHVFARALQPLGIGLALLAVTSQVDVADALVGQAVAFVGTSAGDLVPLQLGTTDGGWALAAPLLKISTSEAVAVSLVVHLVQGMWSAVGALVPAVWRAESARSVSR